MNQRFDKFFNIQKGPLINFNSPSHIPISPNQLKDSKLINKRGLNENVKWKRGLKNDSHVSMSNLTYNYLP